jgi:insulysin
LSPVYRDVEHIKILTKNDILEFINEKIHPSSSARAKVSVHLIAHTSAAAFVRAGKESTGTGDHLEAYPIQAEQHVAAVNANVSLVPSTKSLVRIEDVKAWKAGLQLSAAATPVKSLSAFEDLI